MPKLRDIMRQGWGQGPYMPFGEKATPPMPEEDRSEATDWLMQKMMPLGMAAIPAALTMGGAGVAATTAPQLGGAALMGLLGLNTKGGQEYGGQPVLMGTATGKPGQNPMANIPLHGLVNKGIQPAPKVRYVRFGRLPDSGRSVNGASHLAEDGVSVYRQVRVGGKWHFDNEHGAGLTTINISGRPLYEVTGKNIGIGSDGEPILSGAAIVRKLQDGQKAIPNVVQTAWKGSRGGLAPQLQINKETGLYRWNDPRLSDSTTEWMNLEDLPNTLRRVNLSRGQFNQAERDLIMSDLSEATTKVMNRK